MLNNFLYNLSYRKQNENDLSDITWVVCQTSEKFKELFLRFFFDFQEEDFLKNIVVFKREKSKDSSRPDFYIEYLKNEEKLIYLIEVKIGDKNHHFDYVDTFNIPKNRLGYITNYQHKESGFVVKTWEEFYDFIKNQLSQDEEEKKLWLGYLEYLKSVCSIIKITKKMDLKGMYSLYAFEVELKKILKNEIETENFNLKYHSDKSDLGFKGFYFEIDYKDKQRFNKIWAWVGVYYDTEEPVMCLSFDNRENWAKPIYDVFFEKIDSFNNGEFSTKPYRSGDNKIVWFNFSRENDFNETDLFGQIEFIKNFIVEVVSKPLEI